MTDDTETYATMADELLLLQQGERAFTKQLVTIRKLKPDDPSIKLLQRRIGILGKVEALLRKAHDAGRRP